MTRVVRWFVIAVGCVLTTGCPKPLPTPAPNDNAVPVEAGVALASTCSSGVTISQSELCTNAFTPNGTPCAVCAGKVPTTGCLLPAPDIFCVTSCARCAKHRATP